MGFSKKHKDRHGEAAWAPDDRVINRTLRKHGIPGTAANRDRVREQMNVNADQAARFERSLRDEARRRGRDQRG